MQESLTINELSPQTISTVNYQSLFISLNSIGVCLFTLMIASHISKTTLLSPASVRSGVLDYCSSSDGSMMVICRCLDAERRRLSIHRSDRAQPNSLLLTRHFTTTKCAKGLGLCKLLQTSPEDLCDISKVIFDIYMCY